MSLRQKQFPTFTAKGAENVNKFPFDTPNQTSRQMISLKKLFQVPRKNQELLPREETKILVMYQVET